MLSHLDATRLAALNDPSGGVFPSYKSAGMIIVSHDKTTKKKYALFVMQHKTDDETKQWSGTLSTPAGKATAHPDKVSKKTGQPAAIKGTPQYDALLQRHQAEATAPTLTALREAHEETGLPVEELARMFDDQTVVLFNNGYDRFVGDAQKMKDYRNGQIDAPYIVYTYVVQYSGDRAELLKACKFDHQTETSEAVWVELHDTLFPQKDKTAQEHEAFFQSTYVNNENYEVPAFVETMPDRKAGHPWIFPSYVARSIHKDLTTIVNAAA